MLNRRVCICCVVYVAVGHGERLPGGCIRNDKDPARLLLTCLIPGSLVAICGGCLPANQPASIFSGDTALVGCRLALTHIGQLMCCIQCFCSCLCHWCGLCNTQQVAACVAACAACLVPPSTSCINLLPSTCLVIVLLTLLCCCVITLLLQCCPDSGWPLAVATPFTSAFLWLARRCAGPIAHEQSRHTHLHSGLGLWGAVAGSFGTTGQLWPGSLLLRMLFWPVATAALFLCASLADIPRQLAGMCLARCTVC